MMLLQIITHQPRMLGAIVLHTPGWVWGLLAALLALGATQLFDRQASVLRVSAMPLAMACFALYGLVSAFGDSHLWIGTLALWLATAAAGTALALWLRPSPPEGTRFDAQTAHFALPGSLQPLALIGGIFLVKYGVGVELVLQPAQAHDPGFAYAVALLYGGFNGLFAARLIRLWRLRHLHLPLAATPPAAPWPMAGPGSQNPPATMPSPNHPSS